MLTTPARAVVLALTAATWSAPATAEVDWSAAIGAEVNADPHGVFDVEARSGPWSASLYTDTLDLRYAPEFDHGKAWVGVRGEAFVAGLMPSPWIDGAPAPEHALTASYGQVDGGGMRYLAHGVYVGAQAAAAYYSFGETPDTTVAVPEARVVTRGDAILGLWRPSLQVYSTVGAHFVPIADTPLQPSGQVSLRARPESLLTGPLVELRAGRALGQDFVTRTRLGGLNPYVVPLAGAAWAEWWVEDYAALRLGPHYQGEKLSLALVADGARFDGGQAVGFGAVSALSLGRWTTELSLGHAPWIERAPDVGRSGLWFRVRWAGGATS